MKEYKEKIISLEGNKKLINACKKLGLQLHNPKGKWNGYGYDKLPMSVTIRSLSEMRAFNKLKNESIGIKKVVLSDEEKIEKWANRLSKLTGISLEDALIIAEEKLEYKSKQIEIIEDRQREYCSIEREKLINKMKRENPLRHIKNIEHAEAIVSASSRHNTTNYESMLNYSKDLVKNGEIENSKEFARKLYK